MALTGVDMQGSAEAPVTDIDAAFGYLRDARPRPDVELREIPAPGRGVASHGMAFEAELLPDPVVSGRFVVLHDPAGQAAWGSTTRVIILVQGEIDEVTSSDPLLPDVTWSWLEESLEGQQAGWHHARGTVTTTASRRFGEPEGAGDAGDPGGGPECDVELRASWSPDQPTQLLPHLAAFCDLLAAVAGVPPPVPGLSPITGLPSA